MCFLKLCVSSTRSFLLKLLASQMVSLLWQRVSSHHFALRGLRPKKRIKSPARRSSKSTKSNSWPPGAQKSCRISIGSVAMGMPFGFKLVLIRTPTLWGIGVSAKSNFSAISSCSWFMFCKKLPILSRKRCELHAVPSLGTGKHISRAISVIQESFKRSNLWNPILKQLDTKHSTVW